MIFWIRDEHNRLLHTYGVIQHYIEAEGISTEDSKFLDSKVFMPANTSALKILMNCQIEKNGWSLSNPAPVRIETMEYCVCDDMM